MNKIWMLAVACSLIAVPAIGHAEDDSDEARDMLWDSTPFELDVDVEDTGEAVVDVPLQAAGDLSGEVAEVGLDIGNIILSPFLALGYALRGLGEGDLLMAGEGLFLIPASPIMKAGGAFGHRVAEYSTDAANAGIAGLEVTSRALGNEPNEYEHNVIYEIPAWRIAVPGASVSRFTDTVGIDSCTTCTNETGAATLHGMRRE